MGRLEGGKLRTLEGGQIAFWCPGCKTSHAVAVEAGGWTWDGNAVKPTITPSVLVTGGHYSARHKPGDPCWCTFYEKHPEDKKRFGCGRCHLFVTAGRLQFLQDCSHELAGQTVELPLWPGDFGY